MAKFEFSKDEMNDLIYAAREAEIRFKRARTEYRAGNPSYSQWHPEDLEYNIKHYKGMEQMLKDKYREAFGEYWD